ncbi:flagellar motor stator protein MotA [Hydrocarboniclastica marina]|uniref:Flagellar motor stator protein MotA n=1 Tax=Hydrocarboniclastica marina TaxID=2259620 RepID=A0A4P7XL06_9ALTE|nr:flagellar motor stator protein MotA [Hydrocarboniclastica marina]MAL97530.1 flagellar motor stator protein MotA [Alteromonadaceae bacterium]QCF26627.1 flagellar motor stator protein MotA [Hydrocarboniclastica marina]|tara:strand:- start:2965 stop:3816 length:852 start_codon:yes stop_codon:yes gene_type:complete
MTIIFGSLLVIASVVGGYVLSHGQMAALWQPYEVLIIGGAALGAFVIANPMHTLKHAFSGALQLLTGSPYNKAFYMDLLSLLYDLFDKSRKQGVMAIEADVDNPAESQIFTRYPAVLKQKHLIAFITDYLRIISSGNMAAHELEGLMEQEIDTRLEEVTEPAHAINKVSDALPGFGIVAAVLGIVITMGSLGGPPEEIGAHVAAALVGTFLGILMAYGFVGPMATSMEHQAHYEIKAYACVKSAIIATVSGQAPQMAIEFGRKALQSEKRPDFQELNDHVRSK